MAIKYNILGGLALLASQVNGWTWDIENRAKVRESVPSAGNPNIQSLEPMFFKDMESKRVRVKYGPHSVPGMNSNSSMGMAGMAGAVFLDRNATKPCGDCLITWMKADLVYEDGKSANTDTGLWLHHAVALNRERKDAVCGKTVVPIQRFFASGNERTEVNFALSGKSKTGYLMRQKDSIAMLMEFMNEGPEARNVTMTIDYEYIPAMKAKDAKFERLESLWLDIGGCMGSDQPAKSNTTFDYEMPEPFELKRNGRIIGLGSHLHDGGAHLEIKQNDKRICDSVAQYGTSPGYISTSKMPEMPGMPAMETKMTHVSEISTCNNAGEFKKGDKLSIKAFYDMEKHAGMKEMDGKLAEVMGISVVYVVAERNNTNGTAPGGGAAGGPTGGNPMLGGASSVRASWTAAGSFGLVAFVASLLL